MSEKTYYQSNKEVILNRAKDYYHGNIKRLKVEERNKYRQLSER